MHALLSIHDVMPETLADVRTVLAELADRGLGPVTLLVVPGRCWRCGELAQLQRWQGAGHELAGHGWSHRADTPASLYHRLHAALLSRSSAEHLALTDTAIRALLERNHTWFAAQGLTSPELYVPPAWALGPIARAGLAAQPFAHIETLRGVYDVRTARCWRLPLIGFEADTLARASALRLWNRMARRGGPVRVAIHPGDLRLRLRHEMIRVFDRIATSSTYGAWRRACSLAEDDPSA